MQYEKLICSILRGEGVFRPDAPDFSRDGFLRASAEHGVSALVYYNLVQSGSVDDFPRTLIENLQRIARQHAAVELLRYKEILETLTLFRINGIVPILLKGAALSYSHYPSPELRERCDTDLFIRVDDIVSVQRILEERGYQIDYPRLKSHQFTCYRNDDADRLYLFDIHWRISNESQYARVIGFEEALLHSVELPRVAGARVLNALHALVQACVHLVVSSSEGHDRLIRLYDIHLLVCAMSDDALLKFAEFAVERKIQGECLQAVMLAGKRFHTDIPPGMERILTTPRGESGFIERFRQSNIGLYFDDLQILPGFELKAKLMRELIFPPPEYLMRQYGKENAAWVPLLYIRHILGGSLKRVMMK